MASTYPKNLVTFVLMMEQIEILFGNFSSMKNFLLASRPLQIVFFSQRSYLQVSKNKKEPCGDYLDNFMVID